LPFPRAAKSWFTEPPEQSASRFPRTSSHFLRPRSWIQLDTYSAPHPSDGLFSLDGLTAFAVSFGELGRSRNRPIFPPRNIGTFWLSRRPVDLNKPPPLGFLFFGSRTSHQGHPQARVVCAGIASDIDMRFALFVRGFFSCRRVEVSLGPALREQRVTAGFFQRRAHGALPRDCLLRGIRFPFFGGTPIFVVLSPPPSSIQAVPIQTFFRACPAAASGFLDFFRRLLFPGLNLV